MPGYRICTMTAHNHLFFSSTDLRNSKWWVLNTYLLTEWVNENILLKTVICFSSFLTYGRQWFYHKEDTRKERMRKTIKARRGKTELFHDNSTVEIFWMGGASQIPERDKYQYTSTDNHSSTHGNCPQKEASFYTWHLWGPCLTL